MFAGAPDRADAAVVGRERQPHALGRLDLRSHATEDPLEIARASQHVVAGILEVTEPDFGRGDFVELHQPEGAAA